MIVHKRSGSVESGRVQGRMWHARDSNAEQTVCGKKITPTWMKEDEGNCVPTMAIYEFQRWQQEEGTLSFMKEICEDCELRGALIELSGMDLGGEQAMPERAPRSHGLRHTG